MTKIKPETLSSSFRVIQTDVSHADALYPLYCSNRQYFDCFQITPTRDRLITDMTMLPDGCREEQKHFLIYCDGGSPIALLDLIESYPEDEICYIGLFMVDTAHSGRGVGSGIIRELCTALEELGFKELRLAYGKHYAHAAYFWTNNGFAPIKEAFLEEYGELIVAQRIL